ELLNVERAILAGVVSETTAALVQDREARVADGRADAIAALKHRRVREATVGATPPLWLSA
ncbi:MAG TPA: hypothetical protein VK535_12855, partial [Gemmatimonadales bacterium]|nr:hypothetical protein [Gemmatimonadales bacterium]